MGRDCRGILIPHKNPKALLLNSRMVWKNGLYITSLQRNQEKLSSRQRNLLMKMYLTKPGWRPQDPAHPISGTDAAGSMLKSGLTSSQLDWHWSQDWHAISWMDTGTMTGDLFFSHFFSLFFSLSFSFSLSLFSSSFSSCLPFHPTLLKNPLLCIYICGSDKHSNFHAKCSIY